MNLESSSDITRVVDKLRSHLYVLEACRGTPHLCFIDTLGRPGLNLSPGTLVSWWIMITLVLRCCRTNIEVIVLL